MNVYNSNKLRQLVDRLESARSIASEVKSSLEFMRGEYREKLDNMPDNLKEGDAYNEMVEIFDDLDYLLINSSIEDSINEDIEAIEEIREFK